MANRYVYIEHNDLLFQAKLEYEGVVLDIFDKNEEVIKTHYKYYEDMGLTAPKEMKNEPT
jgi:hypothetical protein